MSLAGRQTTHNSRVWTIVIVAWLVAAATAIASLSSYAATPGRGAEAPPLWPAETALDLDPERPTLVMFVHPRCSCSRASIGELARIMTRLPGKVSAEVVFIKPRNVPADWERTDLWDAARGLQGVGVRSDWGGREAARFGANTSGQVLLYAPSGRRLFAGGITPGRSHMGDSAGREAIVDIVETRRDSDSSTLVFGCPLRSLESQGAAP